ncbi:hypothetical protein KFK14_11295 [Sphingobium phenoxybenzoativorans]|uniref:Phage tail protein n=1 Tax=Sphingobium phenoxybenzoativorans TaxID=1592790 RepID=A0A975Q3H6_9SPHN|nr:phage tail tube protein [Sphingobium phenoxybenzoativorans]QUT07914.1 hypothetical protein KFK14_11295 [Sphingobium phenoxybenzoativorans]
MAGENQEASIGWGGEVHLFNGTTLYELHEVVSFTLPPDTDSEVDATHLKSPGRRRSTVPGLIEDSTFQVVLNYRPLSDTDILIRAARAARDTRAMKLVIPQNGQPFAQVELTAKCTGHSRGEISPEGVMQATVTFQVKSDEDFSEYQA